MFIYNFMTQFSHCGCDHEHDEEATETNDCCQGGCCQGHEHAHAHEESGCDSCHGHCHEISEEDLEKLKAVIQEAGYKIEETPDGEVKIIKEEEPKK